MSVCPPRDPRFKSAAPALICAGNDSLLVFINVLCLCLTAPELVNRLQEYASAELSDIDVYNFDDDFLAAIADTAKAKKARKAFLGTKITEFEATYRKARAEIDL